MHSQIIIQCRHTHIQCTMNSLEVTQLFVERYMGGGGGGGGQSHCPALYPAVPASFCLQEVGTAGFEANIAVQGWPPGRLL